MKFKVESKNLTPRQPHPEIVDIPNVAVEPGVEFYNSEDVYGVIRPYFNTYGTSVTPFDPETNMIKVVDTDGFALITLTKCEE